MNTERLNLIADAIEAEGKVKLDMRKYAIVNMCGTTACIAGFSAILFNGIKPGKEDDFFDYHGEGREALDLLYEESAELFFGYTMNGYGPEEYRDDDGYLWMSQVYSPKQIADALRWMAKTEVINWFIALEAIGAKS